MAPAFQADSAASAISVAVTGTLVLCRIGQDAREGAGDDDFVSLAHAESLSPTIRRWWAQPAPSRCRAGGKRGHQHAQVAPNCQSRGPSSSPSRRTLTAALRWGRTRPFPSPVGPQARQLFVGEFGAKDLCVIARQRGLKLAIPGRHRLRLLGARRRPVFFNLLHGGVSDRCAARRFVRREPPGSIQAKPLRLRTAARNSRTSTICVSSGGAGARWNNTVTLTSADRSPPRRLAATFPGPRTRGRTAHRNGGLPILANGASTRPPRLQNGRLARAPIPRLKAGTAPR